MKPSRAMLIILKSQRTHTFQIKRIIARILKNYYQVLYQHHAVVLVKVKGTEPKITTAMKMTVIGILVKGVPPWMP